MKKNTLLFHNKSVIFLIALSIFILLPTALMGQLVAWQFGSALGNESSYSATTNNSNLQTSILTRGTGVLVNTGLALGYTSNSWISSSPTLQKAIDAFEYLEFKIQAKAGYCTSLSTLDAKLRRTTTGPEYYQWKYSIDGTNFIDISNPGFTSVPDVDAGTQQNQISLSSIADLQNVANETIITFRIYAWGASGSAGSFGFAKTVGTSNCLEIGGTVDALTLSSSASSISLAKTSSSTATATITSNTTWTATSDQTWLSVSGATKGNGTLTFTATETNPTILARTATVTLSATNMTNRTITVTQEAGDPTLSVSAPSATISKGSGSTSSLTVTSNTTWTATSNQTWLTVTPGATGNATLTFTTTFANPTIMTRFATVTLKATGVANKNVYVTQDVGDATLSLSGTTAAVTNTTGSTAILAVTSNSSWTATSDQTWLSVTPNGVGNGTITFTTTSANPNETNRVATVTIVVTGATNKTVTVTQAGKTTLSVSGTTAAVTKASGSTASLTVSSNSTWTTSSDQTWLTVSSGTTGNGTITFTTSSVNPYITSRYATATISADGISKTVTVTQAAGDPTLSVSETTANIAKSSGSTSSLTVFSNSTWTATSNQTWLTVTSGVTGDGTIIFTTTSDNPYPTTRSATVTINANGAASSTVTVNQAVGDATLFISGTTAALTKASGSTANVTVTSNVTWTVSCDQAWLILSAGATGNGTITFTSLDANPYVTPRVATVTINANGTVIKTVTVTQAAGDPTLSVGTTGYIYKESGSTTSVNIMTNSSWTATSDQTWLSVTPSGTGNGSIVFTTTSANPYITTRVATVTVAVPGLANKTVTVTQEMGVPTLSVSGTTAAVTKESGSAASLTVTSNSTWGASSNQTWLTVTSGATGNGTITFTTLSTNPDITPRVATVTISATGIENKTVTVTQAIGDDTLSVIDPNFHIPVTTADIDNYSGGTRGFWVKSNNTWTASTNQPWLSVTASGVSGVGDITFTTTSANPYITSRLAIITIITARGVSKTVTVTQVGAYPTLSVSSDMANVTKANGSSTSLTVASNSTWTATSNQPWLTVTSGATGDGTITFTTTSANPYLTTRIAYVTLSVSGTNSKIVTVTQAVGDATLSVSGTTAALSKSIGSTSLTVSSNSTWTATSDQSWLTVTSGRTGDGTITFVTLTANPYITTRVATVTISAPGIASKTVTVTQAVGDATLSVSGTTTDVTKASGSTASLTVTSNSTWIATSDQNWLTVTSGTTGDGTITFTTSSANPYITTRVATVTIAATGVISKTVTVTQAVGDATLSVSGTTAAVTKASGSTASLSVTSNSTWTASSNQTWLTVTSGATGNGTITFTTSSANPFITTRVATVTLVATGVATKTITITQAVGDATLSVSGTTADVTKASGSTASLSVTSNSTWIATSNQNWLTVTSGTTGDGTITFTTSSANPYITTRVATVTISAPGITSKTVTVTQAVGDATLSVSGTTAAVTKASSSTASLTVTSNSTWTASSDQSWLAVTSGATGDGTITFTTSSANPFITTRVATVTIAATGVISKTVTVTQAVGDATLSVSGTTADVTKASGSTASLSVTSNSTWTATSDQSWLTVTSGATGNGTITFTTSSANPFITTRVATVTLVANGVATKTITITQAVGDATLSVSGTTATVTKASGSTASLSVTSNSTWTASSNQSWLTVTSGATGNGTITFTTSSANPFITTRVATVTISANGATNKIVTVTQAMGDATLSVSGTTATVTKANGSTANLTVTSNSTWTASSNQSWLTVTSGATGNGTITVTTSSANPYITTRVATVTIAATGVISKTVTVTQAVGDATLSVSGNTAIIDVMANNTAFINVSSNTTWTAVSSENWLSVNTNIVGNGKLTFTASNTTDANRQAIVTVSAPDVSDIIVYVNQKWAVNTNKYQLNMTVTAIVSVDDVEYMGNDLQIAAYIGDECRGIADLKYIDVYQRYMAFLTIWGNGLDVNKAITFKCYNNIEEKQFTAINQSLIFIPEVIKGTPVNPYSINLVQKVTALNNDIDTKIEIYPNPVKKVLHVNCDVLGIQQLDIFDTMGRKLSCKSLTNNTDYDVSNLTSGVYLLRIKHKGQEYFKKFICKK